MAKVGEKLVFHGAFKSKRKAMSRERKGQFILGRKIEGSKRFVLVSRRKK